MATGTKAYIEDRDGNKILPATDWSIIQNKPGNLATTNQLPTLTGQQRDGINYFNGAYDYDHVNNGWNCTYRIADMGSFKLVELRLIFAINKDVAKNGWFKCIELPKIISPDQNIQSWYPTSINGVIVEQRGLEVGINAWGDHGYSKDSMISYHNTYLTTL